MRVVISERSSVRVQYYDDSLFSFFLSEVAFLCTLGITVIQDSWRKGTPSAGSCCRPLTAKTDKVQKIL